MTDEFIAQERKNVAEIYLPNTDTWVLELDEEVKGFIALMGNEVGAIFLQPECRGKRTVLRTRKGFRGLHIAMALSGCFCRLD